MTHPTTIRLPEDLGIEMKNRATRAVPRHCDFGVRTSRFGPKREDAEVLLEQHGGRHLESNATLAFRKLQDSVEDLSLSKAQPIARRCEGLLAPASSARTD